MNRIFDLEPADETDVVDRVLMHVHTAIDENFPGITGAPRQFTKTVFSQGGESTALLRAAIPDSEKDGEAQLPPPPSKRKSRSEDDELFLPSEEQPKPAPKPQPLPFGVTKQPITKSRGPEKIPNYQELQSPIKSGLPGGQSSAAPQTSDLYSSAQFKRRLDLGTWVGLIIFVLALVLVGLVLFVF